MRTAFIQSLCELADHDERIWLICGDLGFEVLDVFASRFPHRFLNAGVAEQNMTGLAVGLAMTGKIVFTYSIANFPVMRCLEQIRNDICYHRANVKVVAVGGGLAYGAHGYTHHGVEDLAVMRVLPYMTVVAPGDPVESLMATRAIAAYAGPCYLRLGKTGEPPVHSKAPAFVLGKAILLQEGEDVTLISTGGMLQATVHAGQRLAAQGVSARVLSMPTLQPLDERAVLDAARTTRRIVTVEEHGLGGLFSAVAEVTAQAGLPTPLVPRRLQREPFNVAGEQLTLRRLHGLCAEGIVRAALSEPY